MKFLRPRSLVTSAVATALLTLVSTVAAAQGGTITGTVTEQGAGTPLQEARVIVLGSSLVTTTGPDGKYTLRRVPAGAADIRVIRVGYTEQKKSINVTEGGSATLDFAMAKSIVQLQEVVTTATGEQRRVEVGNAVETINTADITQTAPEHTNSDVLAARVPCVSVQ